MNDVSHEGMNYPKWLDREEYPFKSHYFQLPVGKMHYVDEGVGSPVVMVHGNPGWSFEFRKIIRKLSESHRCIAPDHIGFGLSDKPYDFDYLPASQARNFELFIDSLDLNNITFVFNDWGGPIALSYAIKHPEKIRKLIILNSWFWSVEDDPHFQKFSNMMGGTIGRWAIKNFNVFGKMVVKQAMGDKRKLTKHIHRHYYKHLKTRKDRKGCWTFPGQIIGSSRWLDSLWQQRDKITAIPATIVWGMKDIAFKEKELNRWVENWKKAKVIRLGNTGHYPQEESPDEVINAIRE